MEIFELTYLEQNDRQDEATVYTVGKGGCAAVGGAILAMPRRNIDLLKPPETYFICGPTIPDNLSMAQSRKQVQFSNFGQTE